MPSGSIPSLMLDEVRGLKRVHYTLDITFPATVPDKFENFGNGGPFVKKGTPAIVAGPNKAVIPYAPKLDGTNDNYSRDDFLYGVEDSPLFIISAWLRFDGGDGVLMKILVSSVLGINFRRSNANQFQIAVENAAGTIIANWRTSAVFKTSPTYIHLLASCNLDAPIAADRTHLLIDGISDKVDVITPVSDTIDHTKNGWGIGSSPAGVDRLNGAIGSFYFAPGQFLDLSEPSELLKFRNLDGTPVDLGENGSLPTGTVPAIYFTANLDRVRRYAKTDIASDSKGSYLGDVTNFGTISRAASFPSLGLDNPRQTVSVFDEDRKIQTSLGGSASGKAIGSPAAIVLRSFHVPASSHYTRLAGEIKDYNPAGDRIWDFVLGPETTPLESKLKIPRLSREDWPVIPEQNRDKAGQMPWGEFLSSGRDATGLIQAFLVDETLKYWYICFGHLPELGGSSITTVFVNTAEQTSDFTMRRIIRNGRPYTVLEQTSGTPLTIADDVTVDLLGLGDRGDGGGVTEKNPADILQIMLNNVVFGEFPIGAVPGTGTDPGWRWLVNFDHHDDSSFISANAFLTTLHHEIAGVFTSDQTGFDLISQWVDTFKCPIFWSDEFKLKIGCFNFFQRNIYAPPFISQGDGEVLRPLAGKTFGEERQNRMLINYMLDPASNSFDRSFLAANEDAPFVSQDTLNYILGGPSRVP